MRATGLSNRFPGGGAVLGALSDWTDQICTLQLDRGNKLWLSGDGIAEAENPGLEACGEQLRVEAARGRIPSILDSQRDLMQRVTAFSNGTSAMMRSLLVRRVT
jgi:hypothetical protein